MATLDYDTFAKQLNSGFVAVVQAADPEEETDQLELALELVEADDKTNERCECFSLVFNGPADTFLPQGTYAMRHDALGEFDLFLVPVGENQAKTQYHYQAIFNRLKEPQQP